MGILSKLFGSHDFQAMKLNMNDIGLQSLEKSINEFKEILKKLKPGYQAEEGRPFSTMKVDSRSVQEMQNTLGQFEHDVLSTLAQIKQTTSKLCT